MKDEISSLVNSIGNSELSPQQRKEAGDRLAELGDPRFLKKRWYLPDEPALGFVEIPAGPFLMGEGKEAHQVELRTYYVSRYPVTVSQFQVFVNEAGYTPKNDNCLKGIANHPVTWISWYEARDYCEWLQKILRDTAEQHDPGSHRDPDWSGFWADLASGHYVIDLLSEAQWEKAGRGPSGARFPWGNEIAPSRANYKDTLIAATTPVGCFPAGASPYGILDMSGNVWNWTLTLWGKSLENPAFKLPYDPFDGREDTTAPAEVLRCMRGGAFPVEAKRAESVFRDAVEPNSRDDADGFRVGLVPV